MAGSSSTERAALHVENGQALTNTSAHNRAALQPAHQLTYQSYYNNISQPQPPPMKKMSPMPARLPPKMVVMNSSAVAATAKPAILAPNPQVPQVYSGMTMHYLPPTGHRLEDMRVQFEHDGHLAAKIAPPTPPSTPASSKNN